MQFLHVYREPIKKKEKKSKFRIIIYLGTQINDNGDFIILLFWNSNYLLLLQTETCSQTLIIHTVFI